MPRRFLVVDGAPVPANYFDLSGLSEEITRNIYVYMIIQALAIEIDQSHLGEWEAYRAALIAA